MQESIRKLIFMLVVAFMLGTGGILLAFIYAACRDDEPFGKKLMYCCTWCMLNTLFLAICCDSSLMAGMGLPFAAVSLPLLVGHILRGEKKNNGDASRRRNFLRKVS